LAQLAIMHLWTHGVMARTTLPNPFHNWVALYVIDVRQRDKARDLLAQYQMERPRPEAGWEFHTRPDLSRLNAHDPALLDVRCPRCDALLPPFGPDANETRACPSCAAPIDLPELIALRHGPEALAACYPDDIDVLDEAALRELPLLCPQCGYSLAGIAGVGVCPECAAHYDKRELLRELRDG
jgi:hypothetical protein